MILYHGSYMAIETPDLEHSRPNLDFGLGFYTTPIKDQAVKWSTRFNKAGRQAVVSRYVLSDAAFELCTVLKFESYSEEWLDFILTCRRGNDCTSYDIVIGGIANDRVFNTVELFFSQLIDKKEALKRLKFEQPNQQICLRSPKALSFLQYEGCENV